MPTHRCSSLWLVGVFSILWPVDAIFLQIQSGQLLNAPNGHYLPWSRDVNTPMKQRQMMPLSIIVHREQAHYLNPGYVTHDRNRVQQVPPTTSQIRLAAHWPNKTGWLRLWPLQNIHIDNGHAFWTLTSSVLQRHPEHICQQIQFRPMHMVGDCTHFLRSRFYVVIYGRIIPDRFYVICGSHKMEGISPARPSEPTMARFVTAVCVLMMASSAGAGSLLSSSQGSNIWNFWSSSNSNSYSVSSGCKNGCQLDKMVSSCPVDVMFLLDGSDSIPPLAFMQARDYVVNQIRNVTSLFQGSDVGVLLFSDGVHEELPLKSRTKADLDTLVSQVLNFKQPRKRTSLPATLRRARRALTDYAAPPLVPGGSRGKMIVLVSDGCLDDLRAVEQEGIQGALDRVYVLSVAISKAYLPILTRISVQVIEQRTPIDWGNTVACPATFLPPLLPGAVCSDFVLAMDGSDSVRNWEGVMRDYLAYMSNRYDGVKNAIGVVVFGSNVTTQATDTVVPPTSDTKWLLEQIKTHLRFPDDGGTGTDAAIRASTALLTSLGRNARKSIIVVTDGPALNPDSARQALADAVALGFGVVVVGVGDVLSQSDLQTMAGPQSTILQIPSYLELFPLDLDSVLCGVGCPGRVLCGPTEVLDPKTCLCRTGNVCPNTCPTNQVNDITCKCVCSQTLSCGAGQVFDQNTCSCVCRQTPNCGANQYFDQNTCGCVCRQTMNCGNNQNFDQNTCSCVCNNNGAPCPFNQQRNPTTCLCVCSQTLSCGAGQVFDQNTCSCVCRQTPNCGANQYFDQNTCGCVCRQTMNCGNNQNFDQNTCSCVCNNNGAPCPFNQQRNPTTCLCECLPTTCPAGQVLSPTACYCQCPNNQPPCPQNMRRNIFSCQCECNPASCPNQIQDKNTCLCGCPPATPCRAGQVINPNTCQCVCPPSAPCPSGQVWNPNSCQCECPASASAVCQAGQVLNSNCQCVCPNSAPCPNGQFRSPNTCQCVCIPTSCPNGQIQDLNTCQCVCPPSGPCPSGQVRNSNSCQCGCPTSIACKAGQVLNSNCQCVCIQTLNCGTNQYFDQNTCGCVCRQTLSCGASQNFDQNTCSCVCPNNTPCPNGQYRSPNTCQCVCPLNAPCPSGQVRNPNTCQCGCPNDIVCQGGQILNASCQCDNINRCFNSPTCNALQQQNPINCQCNCINTLNCPSGTTFDTNTCTCKCLNTVNCPSGTTFDTNTCTCINVCPNTVSCGIGSIFDPSKCACVPFCNLKCVNGVPDGACRQCLSPVPTDTPKEKCPPQQTKCQNGQLAYRDCKGRCVCACDERQYTGIYCEFRVEPQLCDNCTYQNGNYLAPVKGRCDMFVVCQPLDAQLTRYDARIQFCPAGTLFQRRGTQLGCFHTGEGVCPLDPCQTLPVGSKYGHSRECGRYFECQSGSTARLMCCPEGQGFNPTTAQCEPDSNCPNTCAGNFTSCTIDGRTGLSCPYQTREDNRQLFYHTAAPGANYTCGARQIFNTTSCVCEDDLTQGCKPTIDYNFNSFTPNNSVSLRSTSGGNGNTGYFDGSARIVILRFAGSGFYTPYLGINLRVKLNGTSGSGQMAILTNADCGVSESLAITVDNSNVYFKIQAEGASRPQVLSVPYSAVPDGWLDLSLRYERQQGNLYRLTGTVNGRSDSADINGVIGTRECALQIGHGLNYSNLIGFVDDFQIWMCK